MKRSYKWKSGSVLKKKPYKTHCSCTCCVWILVTVVLVALAFSTILVYYVSKFGSNKIPISHSGAFSALQFSNQGSNGFSGLEDGIAIGKVERNDAQFCNDNKLKKTFPDFDYATFGYNVIYGYPGAYGHDPGLTHPIFAADYSNFYQSADCQYHVPEGYHLIPDVSCITSFTSQTVRDSRQFSKSLSVSAEASGGGWGVSFSASAEYKKTLSTMSESESVFVFSTAKCHYYVAMMDEKNPPPFSKSFLETVKKMETVSDTYDFFAYYGTHYLTYVLFGARFVYEHKMSKTTFQTQSSEKMSVAVKASYSGLFSLGGGFGMDSSHAEEAKKFLEQVETDTISIGAPPPANGNTMVWASTVKDTPIPVKYKMKSIEHLFISSFFNGTGIDYKKKRELLLKGKHTYCKHLRRKGEVNVCGPRENFLIFNNIWPTLPKVKFPQFKGEIEVQECLEKCLDNIYCVTVHHYPTHKKGEYICILYMAKRTDGNVLNHLTTEVRKGGVNSVFFVLPDLLKLYRISLKLKNAKVKDSYQTRNRTITTETLCRSACEKDPFCSLYTFEKGASFGKYNCYTYDKKTISCSDIPDGALRKRHSTNNCAILVRTVGFNTVFFR